MNFFFALAVYRYSSLPATDNCQLGEKTYRQLDIYFDLIPDRDYDVYVRNEYSRPNCQPTRTWDSGNDFKLSEIISKHELST